MKPWVIILLIVLLGGIGFAVWFFFLRRSGPVYMPTATPETDIPLKQVDKLINAIKLTPVTGAQQAEAREKKEALVEAEKKFQPKIIEGGKTVKLEPTKWVEDAAKVAKTAEAVSESLGAFKAIAGPKPLPVYEPLKPDETNEPVKEIVTVAKKAAAEAASAAAKKPITAEQVSSLLPPKYSAPKPVMVKAFSIPVPKTSFNIGKISYGFKL